MNFVKGLQKRKLLLSKDHQKKSELLKSHEKKGILSKDYKKKFLSKDCEKNVNFVKRS